MKNHAMIKLIQQSDCLPQIPKVFGEALDMLSEPCEFNMDKCIDKLSYLSKLESTLIHVFDYSAKPNRRVSSLKDAVVYLGAKNTRMIAIAYITRLLLPNKIGRAKIFSSQTYWKHCLGTSVASYLIAAESGLCDKDKMFTYGLIHDIGMTVLDICLPDQLDKIYTMQMKQGLHQISAEKIVLDGITHAEIGMWLCKEWGLPEEIAEVVGYHHSPLINSKTSDEVKIMHLADSISTSYYERLLGTHTTFVYFDQTRELLNLTKEFIEGIIKKLPQEIDRVSRMISFDLNSIT